MLTDEQDRKLARLFHGLHAVRRSLAVSMAEEDEQRLTALYHEHLGRL